MGSLRGGDGDGRPPPDDGDLPEFPPEWGVVVIPDDLTELDKESAALQRERRRDMRRTKWRRRLRLPAAKGNGENPSPVGVPLLIMSIAIIAALTSLFAITLTSRSSRSQQSTTAPTVTPQESPQMIDLALTDAADNSVRLRDTLPAAILLLDGCACDQLIRDTVAAAPPGVTVIAIDRTPPVLPVGVNVTTLADPEQALLATYADGPDRSAQPAGVPTAVLVADDGTVTKVANPANRLVDFKNALTALGG
jgi:hypothetical protein